MSLSEQAAQIEHGRRWERTLATKVQLVRGGATIELTGRQIVGLSEVANGSQKGQVRSALGLRDGALAVALQSVAHWRWVARGALLCLALARTPCLPPPRVTGRIHQ